MSEPFIGQITIFSFNFPPKGWATCDGQLLPINQNQALFSILGTTYGGDGRVNFALPDLRGQIPLHVGGGFVQGQTAGEYSHTLTMSEMPAHNHLVSASLTTADKSTPVGNSFASGGQSVYSSASPNSQLVSSAILNTGGSQPHENTPPYLTLNFCIALQGIFPSRN